MTGEPNQVKWRGVRPIAGIDGIWPAIDAARINEDAEQQGAGTAIIYTVPASKKLFIPAAALASRLEANAEAYCDLFVRDGSDVLQYYIIWNYMRIMGQLTTPQSFCPALEADASYDVCVTVSHANVWARGLISGWLEDA